MPADCRMRRRRWCAGIRTWWPASATTTTTRCRSFRLIPKWLGNTSNSDADDVDVDGQIERVCADERAAICDLADQPAFRAALIRTGEDQHRFVLTNHHIVMDGWSMPILLQEIFAGYYGHRLATPTSLSPVCHLAGRSGPRGSRGGLG